MDRKVVFIFLVIVLFITKCSKRDKVETEDKITSPLATYVKDQDKNFDTSLLQGVWWLNFDDNSALFFISGDSLYYVEDQSQPFYIQLKSDTLKMLRDDREAIFKMKTLTQDSLVFYDPTLDEDMVLMKKQK